MYSPLLSLSVLEIMKSAYCIRSKVACKKSIKNWSKKSNGRLSQWLRIGGCKSKVRVQIRTWVRGRVGD